MNSITSDKPGAFLSQSIHESLRLIVVIQFLVSTYTFHLALEIFLVPLLGIIAVMDAICREKVGVYRGSGGDSLDTWGNWISDPGYRPW